jgi:hypothetical protein
VTGVTGSFLSKELNIFPNGLPNNVTLFIPSDDYISYVARTLGFPAANVSKAGFPEYVE